MKNKRSSRFAFTLSIVWFTSALLYSQQPRTFTNHSGQTLLATPLSMSNGTVEMKRESDGRVFQIQVGSLSPADQAWLTSWAARSSRAVVSGSWSILRVHLPISQYIKVAGPEVVGLGRNAARVGATTFEVLLPVGAWVKVSARDHTTNAESLEHLIRYEGEHEWKVTAEGRLMMLSRDGRPPKVVGITLPSNNPGELLASVDSARCEEKVCLDTSSRHLSIPELSRFKIGALVVGTVLSGEDVEPAAALHPNAVSFSLTEESARKIGSFTTLEAMDLRRDRACPDDALGPLPPARDVNLYSFAFTPEIQQSLESNSTLRLLRFFGPDLGKAGAPQWIGLSKNTAIEALHMQRGVKLDAKEVATLPSLRSFTINSHAFPPASAGLSELAKLKELLALNIVANFSKEIFEAWTKNGGLDKLVNFTSDDAHEVKRFTRLRVLEMDLPLGDRRGIVSVSDIGDLPDLRSLTLNSIGDSDLSTLSKAQIKATVESLDLGLRSLSPLGNRDISKGDYVDSKDLWRLSGYTALKRLEVWGGHIKQFDCAQFPGLEVLELRGMDDLKQLVGLSASAHLEALNLYDCKMLATLGAKAPNTRLWMLDLRKCPELNDIAALQQTSGLKFILINECDRISQPLILDKTNSFYSLLIRSCAILQDRNEVRKGDLR